MALLGANSIATWLLTFLTTAFIICANSRTDTIVNVAALTTLAIGLAARSKALIMSPSIRTLNTVNAWLRRRFRVYRLGRSRGTKS